MVLCMIVGCGNRSGRDKGIYFARVPSVVANQGEEAKILSQERRSHWISAISRADLTDEILNNDRVCARHFVSRQAAKAWDRYNVDWVPTLNLGHVKKIDLEQASQRGQRASEKERKRREQQERERALAEVIATKKLRLNEPGGQVSDIPFENELPTHTNTSSQTDEFEYLFSASPKERPFDESDLRLQNSFSGVCSYSDEAET